MPIAKGFLQGAQKGLDLAIPLIMQKRRLDAAESQFNQTLSLKKLELSAEAEQAHTKLQADFLTKGVLKGIETGDTELVNRLLPELQGLGVSVPSSLTDIKGKTPTTLESILAESAQGDPEKALLLKQSLQKPSEAGAVLDRMLIKDQLSALNSDIKATKAHRDSLKKFALERGLDDDQKIEFQNEINTSNLALMRLKSDRRKFLESQKSMAGKTETKIIDGKTFEKVEGGWRREK